MPMNIFAIGASQNIGHWSTLKFLEQGATVTYLLRTPATLETNDTITSFVASGQAHLVKGDALKEDEVANAWRTAVEVGKGVVDLVLFTVGGKPAGFTLAKGASLTTPDLTTRSLQNVLRTMPSTPTLATSPKFIVVSANGVSHATYCALPLALKPLFGWALAGIHNDKDGLERVAFHAAGLEWTEKEIDRDILPVDGSWKTGLPDGGIEVVIVRPAILTDGEEKGKYRTSADPLSGAWTVSRKDTAHFIVTGIWPNWSQWRNKCVTVAY